MLDMGPSGWNRNSGNIFKIERPEIARLAYALVRLTDGQQACTYNWEREQETSLAKGGSHEADALLGWRKPRGDASPLMAQSVPHTSWTTQGLGWGPQHEGVPLNEQLAPLAAVIGPDWLLRGPQQEGRPLNEQQLAPAAADELEAAHSPPRQAEPMRERADWVAASTSRARACAE